MLRTRLLSVFLLSAWVATQLTSADVDLDDLRPGLIATYRDMAKPTSIEFVKVDPTIAIHWKAGEAAHPRLAADGGSVEWQGYVNILRAGNYRFSARLIGKLT